MTKKKNIEDFEDFEEQNKKIIEDFEKGDTYKILPKDENGENEIVPLKYALGFMVLSGVPYEENELKSIDSLGKYQNKHRYYYYEKFNDKSTKSALFIMFNPSKANPKKDDPTIKNCRKLVQDKYESMEIINLFSERNPKVKEIDFDGETNKLNSEFITTLLKNKQKNNVDIILAWGYGKEKITKYQIQINTIKEQLQGHNNLKHLKHKKSKDEILICHPSNSFWNTVGGFTCAELAKLEILKDNDEYIYQ